MTCLYYIPGFKLTGHLYGPISVDNVLRGRKTVSRHVASMADDARIRVKEMLSIPLRQRSLTISPDYWCDRHKRISYLGLSATFVDEQYGFKSIDLFCRPFNEKTKSADSTLKVFENTSQYCESRITALGTLQKSGIIWYLFVI